MQNRGQQSLTERESSAGAGTQPTITRQITLFAAGRNAVFERFEKVSMRH